MFVIPERVRHHILFASIRAIQVRLPRWERAIIVPLLVAELVGRTLQTKELVVLLVKNKNVAEPLNDIDKARLRKNIEAARIRVSKCIEETRSM